MKKEKKPLTLWQDLLLDFGVGTAVLVVMILLKRRSWYDYLTFVLIFTITLWPRIGNKRHEKWRKFTILHWTDETQEPAPDFLLRPMQQKAERYNEPVTLQCCIRKMDKDGTIDTGCDVYIKTADWVKDDPWNAAVMRSLHPGDFITVVGHIGTIFAGFMNIEDIVSIEKTAPVLPEEVQQTKPAWENRSWPLKRLPPATVLLLLVPLAIPLGIKALYPVLGSYALWNSIALVLSIADVAAIFAILFVVVKRSEKREMPKGTTEHPPKPQPTVEAFEQRFRSYSDRKLRKVLDGEKYSGNAKRAARNLLRRRKYGE